MEKNQIVIKSGTCYQEMTREILEYCDLEAHILDKSKELYGSESRSLRIGVKPNLVAPVTADYGSTTHPEIVAGILEYLKSHGFENLVILEGSWVGDRTEESYEVCGYKDLCETYAVPFLDMQKERGVTVSVGDLELRICKAVTELDFLINVPVLKGHCQTKVTCALKNLKGLLPNSEKRHFHAMGLHKPIGYLSEAIHQDFIVVDNICGDLDFEDGGNPVVMNRILAATDPVLVDAYACKLLQYEIEEIPYIGYAAERGIGNPDLTQAEILYIDTEKSDKPGSCLERHSAHNQNPCTETEHVVNLHHWTLNDEELPIAPRRKVVDVMDQVEEVESCSACYAYLIPALDRLKSEGLLDRLNTKICIGQGYRGKSGELGIGNCTAHFRHHLGGCPPLEHEVYDFLKNYIEGK